MATRAELHELHRVWSLEIETLYARARDAHAGDANERGVGGSGSASAQADALEVQFNRVNTLLEAARREAMENDDPALLLNFGVNIPISWYIAPYAFAITGAIRQINPPGRHIQGL